MEIVQTILQAGLTAVTFLLVLTILVFVHELGHYWVAKLFGMHVESFAVMMGGVRKTDLSDRLKGKLTESWKLWLIGSLVVVATIAGALLDIEILFVSGMACLVVGGPVWVISRLCALYHLPIGQGLRLLLMSWAVIALILMLGTQFKAVPVGYTLSMFLAGSVVAVLLTYYQPVLKKAEDAKMGEGQIVMDGVEVPVRFRPVWSRENKEGTEFSLLLLPLGGFAAIKGMHPKDDGSEIHIEKGFYSKPAWQRFLVLFAGPFFSLGFGVLCLFLAVYGKGIPEATLRIDGVAVDSAGAKADLRSGDLILSVNGEKVTTWQEMTDKVQFSYTENGGVKTPTPIDLEFQRDGEVREVTLTPTLSDEPLPIFDEDGLPTGIEKVRAQIGITSKAEFRKVGAGEAFYEAAKTPFLAFRQLSQTATSLSAAKRSVGGPGRMVQETGAAVSAGIWGVLALAGSLSIALGLINLLPVPPLDGGQMVIAFVEQLRGNKRLSMGVQNSLSTVGFFLVVLLMLAPLVLDAGRATQPQKELKFVEEPKAGVSANSGKGEGVSDDKPKSD